MKTFIFLLMLCVMFIPVFTSSLLDLEQKRENERIAEEQRILKEQKRKIYLMGKFDQATKEDFILVPKEYTTSGATMYLRQETLGAYLNMRNAANEDKINLRIASATRNFDYQKDIWEKKWKGVTIVEGKNLAKSFPDGADRFRKILEYSAAPGISRHHWGTDIDIKGAEPKYFETEKGEREYAWLAQNAPLFGFCQTYNQKMVNLPGQPIRETGYNEEKWHWSYLPLARDFTNQYKNLIKEEDIKGFDGDEYVPSLNLISDYVLSINSECL